MSEIIFWRRLDIPGHEIGKLQPVDNGWELSGTALLSFQQNPSKLDYIIKCDVKWHTNAARINGSIAKKEIDITVRVDHDQKWYLNEVESPAVAGCIDIDLGFSPSTNLLPIRRLSLEVGQEAEVKAAWLPFPSLTFELLPQIYKRTGEHTYKYESRGGAFTRFLEVNRSGFVTDYPGIWVAE
jgi:hypothetical protein